MLDVFIYFIDIKKEVIFIKRIGNIYKDIIDIDNIKLAIYNSSKTKLDRADVQKVLKDPDKYAEKVQKLLKKKIFEPSYSTPRKINDGIRLKKRKVCEPDYYPDQIIHWSIYQIVYPIIEKKIPQIACGSVSGRGQVFTKNKVEKWIRIDKKTMRNCLKLDIKKCYDNINHNILYKMFVKKFKDPDLLDIIKILITSYHSSRGKNKGIPIGWVTSQMFAMFYLSSLDNYIIHNSKKTDKSVSLTKIKRMGCKIRLIRYMDDIYIFCSDKKILHMLFDKLRLFLKKYLDLKFKDNHQIFRVYRYSRKNKKFYGRKIDFVGYTMAFYKTGIRKSISLRMSKLANRLRKGKMSLHTCMGYCSYLGNIKHSKTKYFKNNFFRGIQLNLLKSIIYQGNKRKELKLNLSTKFSKFVKSIRKIELKNKMFLNLKHLCEV